MNKLFIILSILSIFLLSGCTATGEFKTVNIPELNTVSKVEVGENMYEKNYAFYKFDKAVKLLEPATIKKFGVTFNNIADNNEFVILDNGEYAGYFSGYYLVDANHTGYFTYGIRNLLPGIQHKDMLDKPVKYKVVPAKGEYYGQAFKYIALYQGKIGNKIKISFREFMNNFARPAFTQDIEYELESDGTATIGFKGLRIKIIKATNVDIEYAITKSYD